jgi:hypothetical protein
MPKSISHLRFDASELKISTRTSKTPFMETLDMLSKTIGEKSDTHLSSTEPPSSTHPDYPGKPAAITEERKAQFTLLIKLESQAVILEQEWTKQLDARDRLRKYIALAQRHPSPSNFPNFDEVSETARGATEYDIFRYVSDCARDTCAAAESVHRRCRRPGERC